MSCSQRAHAWLLYPPARRAVPCIGRMHCTRTRVGICIYSCSHSKPCTQKGMSRYACRAADSNVSMVQVRILSTLPRSYSSSVFAITAQSSSTPAARPRVPSPQFSLRLHRIHSNRSSGYTTLPRSWQSSGASHSEGTISAPVVHASASCLKLSNSRRTARHARRRHSALLSTLRDREFSVRVSAPTGAGNSTYVRRLSLTRLWAHSGSVWAVQCALPPPRATSACSNYSVY